MTIYNTSKIYNQYVDDVLAGKIVACKNIVLACKRYKSWFEREDVYFDYEDVDRRIKLVSKMKHSRGKSAHQPFILLPYQQWIFAGIFGFKWTDTKLRVTKNALIFEARKNGKTAFAAVIAITQLLLENEGFEFDCLANSGAQARLLFNHVKDYCESIDPQKLLFHRFRDTIKMPCKKSFIDVHNSDSMTLDGLAADSFVLDEWHAAKNYDLYQVMKSSQGHAQQPLAIVLSTAGFLLSGFPLYETRLSDIDILEGKKTDDSRFIALYEMDADDDPMNDESVWIKANPSLGETVTVEYLRDQVTMAKNQASLEVGVKTKQFNIFCGSSDVWLHTNLIKSCMETVNIEDYAGCYCYAGVDLAAVSDITAHTLMFPPDPGRAVNPDKFVFKTFLWVPESCLTESVNKTMYSYWKKQKYLNVTSGNVVDYSYILKTQTECIPITQYASCAYDQWNATSWAIDATQMGLPLVPYSQTLGSFNKPTKTFEMLIKQGKVVIDTNEVILWMFDNVVLKFDMHENCKPDKNTREQKIDGVISMLEALGTYLDQNSIDLSVT